MTALIKACLNGPRGRDVHRALPVTPDELATAAAGAAGAGARAIHMHPRDNSGKESLAASDIASAVRAVRCAVPDTPVGVSTGLWIAGGDVGARREAVAGWATLALQERPDFASVNVSEPGFSELSADLQRAGVAVEAGVWSAADAEALASQVPGNLLRILVEVNESRSADEVSAAEVILGRLEDFALPWPRLLHGHNSTCWTLVAHAGRLGLSTRIGLEDTLVGPTGEVAVDNAHLVAMARSCWDAARARGG